MYIYLQVPLDELFSGLKLPTKNSVTVITDITEKFLIYLRSGTVFLSKDECGDMYALLSTYYQQVWFSDVSCASKRN